MKPGLWVPASQEDNMKKSVHGIFAACALSFALLAMSAPTPALAQGTNYAGQCSSYSSPGDCMKCCARFHKTSYLSAECTNSCRIGNFRDSKAKMSPKRE